MASMREQQVAAVKQRVVTKAAHHADGGGYHTRFPIGMSWFHAQFRSVSANVAVAAPTT